MAKDQQESAASLRLSGHAVLIGLMGAGKSTVGRRLSAVLRAPFADADLEIEAAASMSIPEIFVSHGEEAFRDVERRVIARLVGAAEPTIIATGGGAFMNPETRALLLEKTTTIWLRAELDILAQRVGKRPGRPLLDGKDPREALQALIEKRHPFYEQAHITIASRNEPHGIAVKEIIEALTKRGTLVETI